MAVQLIFALGPVEVNAQQIPMEYYGTEEGLPEPRIDHLRVLEDGTLFIGTNGVPTFYDGYKFQKNIHPERLWLINSAKDHDSTTWFMSLSFGLHSFDGHSISPHPASDSIGRLSKTKGRHISLAFDSLNTAYIGLNSLGYFVKVFQNGGVERVPTAPDYKSNSAFIDSRHTQLPFYGSTPRDNTIKDGYLYMNGELVKIFNHPLSGRVHYAEHDSLKVVSVGKTLLIIKENSVTERHFDHGINTLLFDQYNKLWIGFSRGCGFIDFRNSEHYEQVMSDRMVTSFAIDHEEHFWIGTTNGLYKVLNPFTTNYFEGNGIPLARESHPSIVSLTGRTTVLSHPGQFQFKGTKFEPIEVYTGPHAPSDFVQSVNGFWSFNGTGLHHTRNDGGSSFFPTPPLSGIACKKDSTVWYSRGFFIEQIDENGRLLKSINTDSMDWGKEIPHKARIRLIGVENGNPCIIKHTALFTYKEGKFDKIFHESNGKKLLYPTSIQDLGEFTAIGTKNSGLWILHLDTFYHLSTHNGLTSNRAQNVSQENDSTWWVATNGGIHRISFSIENGTFKFTSRVVNKASGLPTSSIYNLSLNNDTLWMSTRSGVSSISLDIFNAHLSRLPSPHISWLKVNGKDTAYSTPLELKHHQNQISFGFKAVTFRSASQKKYDYRLVGETETWQSTTDTQMTYSSLPAGDFVFEVRTQGEGDAKAVSRTAQVAFSISPPFWRRTWFIAVTILLAQLVAALVVWLVNRSKRQRLLLEKNVLTSELKALRAQLNPHFMFNALGAIQGSIIEGSNQDALQNIGKLAHLMRKMLYVTRNKRTTLKETVEVLQLYLDLELARQPDKFTYQIQCDEACMEEMETLNVPPSIIQPFVENAVLHGASKAEGAGMVKVQFEQTTDYIKCQIADNGPGYYQSQGAKKSDHRPLGLTIIQEQIDLLNMDLASKITLTIEEEQGTVVTVMMPLDF